MKINLRNKRPMEPLPNGFTLIELLVVISIIALIAALGLVVGGKAVRSAETSRTRVILGQLMGAAIEYKEQTGNFVTFDIDGDTYDDETLTDDARSINLFVSNVRLNSQPAFEQLQTVEDRLIAGADRSFLSGDTVDGNDEASRNSSAGNTIVDPFSTIIRYYPGSDNLPTGSTATDPEFRNRGMPLRKQAYFASAGPDLKWGAFDDNNEPDEDAEDNIYSFEVK